MKSKFWRANTNWWSKTSRVVGKQLHARKSKMALSCSWGLSAFATLSLSLPPLALLSLHLPIHISSIVLSLFVVHLWSHASSRVTVSAMLQWGMKERVSSLCILLLYPTSTHSFAGVVFSLISCVVLITSLLRCAGGIHASRTPPHTYHCASGHPPPAWEGPNMGTTVYRYWSLWHVWHRTPLPLLFFSPVLPFPPPILSGV